MPLRLGEIGEGLRRLAHGIADGKVLRMERGVLLVHARERHERGDEFAQLLRLGACLVDPLLLSDVHLQQLQAGDDDGDGGFQLVAGVGDELFLLSVGLHDRLDGAA